MKHTLNPEPSLDMLEKQSMMNPDRPIQDLLYESSHDFKERRKTVANAILEPLPLKKTNFLRKGGGNGGSPTRFDINPK